MQSYQFNQIQRKMEKKFGKLRSGEEEDYYPILFPMESNMMKVHRKEPKANSRRVREAILLALYHIEDQIEGKESDVSNFENSENKMLRNAILMVFDPFTNKDLTKWVKTQGDVNDKAFLSKYCEAPIMCLLRIKDSAELWIKKNVSDGYFNFLELSIGNQVSDDNVMSHVMLEMERE